MENKIKAEDFIKAFGGSDTVSQGKQIIYPCVDNRSEYQENDYQIYHSITNSI